MVKTFEFADSKLKSMFDGFEQIQMNVDMVIKCLGDIHKNLYKPDYSQYCQKWSMILETTFRLLEEYMNTSQSDNLRKKKQEFVFRPFFLSMVNSEFDLHSVLSKNEFFSKLVIDELVSWGNDNPDFFKALFPKLGFKNGLIPWSICKALKDELSQNEDQSLYLYVTKHIIDSYGENEEVCSYVFSVKEYRDLIKHFLDNSAEVTGGKYEMNEANEPEFDGFVIV
jgi:hypothetical protein